ncbi:hypothetical protein CONPUDRAFT_148591 [Coniophora puteana RWD-64-598 SS2]|uniref:Uncharacterized protein n=1 Tax=Coniophora puteana (strain RWD-64-598) TaxID=741705 RepID=A0A5M3N5H9_CONPW|nr:uncharacterized protein CONPUDRAFT_148591 [Coniophora puteana RWD-64-598 SS2]EIW86507.1 hypothetical protein CONPUDRAFT_148591 [Coniophora puteana RWD-64-598 SS2]
MNTIDVPNCRISSAGRLAEDYTNAANIQEISAASINELLVDDSALTPISAAQADAASPQLGKTRSIALPDLGSSSYTPPTIFDEDAIQAPRTPALVAKESLARGMSLLELEVLNFDDANGEIAPWDTGSTLRTSATKSRTTRTKGIAPYRKLSSRARKHKKNSPVHNGLDGLFSGDDDGSLLLRRSSAPFPALSGRTDGKLPEIVTLDRTSTLVNKGGFARLYDDHVTDKHFRPRSKALLRSEPSVDCEDPGELADDEDETEGQVDGLASTMRSVMLNSDST